jgi:hypothetical protein
MQALWQLALADRIGNLGFVFGFVFGFVLVLSWFCL